MGNCESGKNTRSQSPPSSNSSNLPYNNGNGSNYILPSNLAKYDNIKNYYNISSSQIGEGTSAKVFEATNSNNEKFAIKRISKEKIKDKTKAIREAEISLKLKHRNILNFFEIYEDSKFIYYVMECGKMDLFEYISKCPSQIIPENTAIEFLIQMLESISFLHSNNIIHCDIKPENFILIFDKENIPIIKLFDFGSAIMKTNNNTQKFKGTLFYEAPEALNNFGYDEKIDEWGIGVIMYIMLLGEEPFDGEGLELENSIKYKRIEFEKIQNIGLRAVNEKLLCRNPSNRISARQGIEMLQKIK